MGRKIVSFSYKVPWKVHVKDVKEDSRELRRRDYVKAIAKQLPYSEKTSFNAAYDIVYNGSDLVPNCDKDTKRVVKQLSDDAQNIAAAETDEKTLMLSFPLHEYGEKKYPFSDDCKIRLWENEDYIETYLGDKNHSSVTYEEIMSYRYLNCCFCNDCRSFEFLDNRLDILLRHGVQFNNRVQLILENKFEEASKLPALVLVDRPSEEAQERYHRNHPCSKTVVHRFLHETCRGSSMAQIVFNGHGELDEVDEGRNIPQGSADSEGAWGGAEGVDQGGGVMCIYIDKTVSNQDIINDIEKCFSSIPSDIKPYQVDIVFAQCHANLEGLVTGNEEVTVTCLVRVDQDVTDSLVNLRLGYSIHLGLEDYAEKRKAERETRSRSPATAPSTDSTAVVTHDLEDNPS